MNGQVFDGKDVTMTFGGVELSGKSLEYSSQIAPRVREPVEVKVAEPAGRGMRLFLAPDGGWAPIPDLDLSRFPLPMHLEARIDHSSTTRFKNGWGTPIEFRCRMCVHDRETGRPAEVIFTKQMDPNELEIRGVEATLFDFLQEAVIHELKECWLVHGHRTLDPHAGEYRALGPSGYVPVVSQAAGRELDHIGRSLFGVDRADYGFPIDQLLGRHKARTP